MVSRAVKLCGTEQVDPPMRTLTAGPLSAEFDNGALRYIRFGGVEVLRAIAFLVRDENWGTFTPTIEDLRDRAVRRRLHGLLPRPPAPTRTRRLVYDARITGRRDGSLAFEVVAEPRTDVLTNRTGFIVLHPVEGVAGRPVRILHVDGREEQSRFPEAIDPRCPFRDIRALVARDRAGRLGDLHDGRRRLRDGGPAQLVRRLLQDLCPPADPALALHAAEGRAGRAGGPARDLRRRCRAAAAAPAGRCGSRSAARSAGCRRSASACRPARRRMRSRPASCSTRLAPRWLVCEVDLRRGHGRAGARALPRPRRADRRRDRAGDRHPRQPRSRRPSSRALATAAAEAGLTPAAVVGLPGAGHEVGPARRALAGDAELRGDLRRGARGLSRREARRRHGDLFHRAEPQAPAGGAARLRHPHDLPDRPRRRRPLGDGDDRGAAATRSSRRARFMGESSPTASARARSAAARTPTASPRRRTPATAASA